MQTQHSVLLSALFTMATANAVPNPIPPSVPISSSACATTIIVTEDSQKPPATWEPTWTITRHTDTVTTHVATDCGGCSNIHTDTLFIDYAYPPGPSSPSVIIVTASEPATATQFSCATPQPEHAGGPFGAAKPQANLPVRRSSGWKSDWKTDKSVFKRDVGDGQPKGFKKGDTCTKLIYAIPNINLGPTATRYTATSTTTQTVDCGPCKKAEKTFVPVGVPPVAVYQTTITAEKPFVATAFACAPPAAANKKWDTQQPPGETSEPHYYEPPPFETYTVSPEGVPSPHCTTQAKVEPPFPNETTTIYGSTETYTSTVDCGECYLEWSTEVLEFFAPIRITATVTASRVSTRTVMTCARATGRSE